MGIKALKSTLTIYRDRDDWWIGWYRGASHHYVCLLPTIVMRWDRIRDDENSDAPNDAGDDICIDLGNVEELDGKA